MSLVALYDALKEANVSNESARAAVEAVDEKQSDERLTKVEVRLATVEATQTVHTGLLIAILVAIVASIWIG